jgi:hypothetical protein
MSYDPSNPQDVGALINAVQGSKQIDLQRQILEMQKLLVLNQVRISQGLQPLAQLPAPPPPPERTPEEIAEGHRTARKTFFKVLALIVAFLFFAFYVFSLKR